MMMMAKQSVELVRDVALLLVNTVREGAHEDLFVLKQREYNQASLDGPCFVLESKGFSLGHGAQSGYYLLQYCRCFVLYLWLNYYLWTGRRSTTRLSSIQKQKNI